MLLLEIRQVWILDMGIEDASNHSYVPWILHRSKM